ncbi:TPA: fimbrial protein [Salmonella enterica]|uniref:Fimbrial protein n=1 Tax=Salmonella enterica TaxID=28901 RepID=A0A763M3U7_SALER|nr:fimbrial protein SteF [Salmonella enterica subsp. enterica]HAG3536120.1 fimbrial protein [Salmonella enterica]HAG4399230.1 fimbrial protein [Salmonella enterica]HAK8823987.1 fimbrial protein [Salmonella enterica]
MNRIFQTTGHLIGGVMLWAVCNTLPAATPNVHYSGKLVAGACNLVVDNDTMATVDFHTIGSDNFDANGQTTPVPFTLSLKDCKTALANGVVVTFQGVEDSTLPGLLALESSSIANGFAIGIETADQHPLIINASQGTEFMLAEGNTIINLQAWLQKTSGENIMPGEFNASAMVNFEYQ